MLIMSGDAKTLSSPTTNTPPTAAGCPLGGRWLIMLSGLLGVLPAEGAQQPIQDLAALTRAAGNWLEGQAIARHPGLGIGVQVTPPDARLRMSACADLRFSLPAGSQPWGTGSLGVRCESPHVWSFYTPYKITLTGPALVSNRAIAARQSLTGQDVESKQVEYQAMPELYLQDRQALTGTVLTVPIGPDTAIRSDMLRRPPLIKAGQRVPMRVEGPGYRISQEGIAQQPGALGENIRLKTANGRIVEGTVAADGSVRVGP